MRKSTVGYCELADRNLVKQKQPKLEGLKKKSLHPQAAGMLLSANKNTVLCGKPMQISFE